MTRENRYWRAAADLDEATGPADGSRLGRRDFLELMGISASALAAACSRAPQDRIVPLAKASEAMVPGASLWYATSCAACPAACGLRVKVRDGRPIKVEGNPAHPWSGGGVCALGQASVLSLYDASRARGPSLDGREVDWVELDGWARAALERVSQSGRTIALIVPSSPGPLVEAAIARFAAAWPATRIVRREPLGERPAIAAAHRATHGLHAVPAPRLDRARVVAAFGADFLGTWISPVAFARHYAASRRGSGLEHHQFEARLSLTGARADRRTALRPSQLRPALEALCRTLMKRAGDELPGRREGVPLDERLSAAVEAAAQALWSARGAALVLCGVRDVETQSLANLANGLLGAYGATLELTRDRILPEGTAFDEFLTRLRGGQVGAALFLGTNPVYDHPEGEELGRLLASLELSVSLSDRRDETARVTTALAPTSHFLESWGAVAPAPGVLGLGQPVIRPLWNTREAVESLLRWAGDERSVRELLAESCRAAAPNAGPLDGALRDGYQIASSEPLDAKFDGEPAWKLLAAKPWPEGLEVAGEGLELDLHGHHALRDGAWANNAWLQELPDPITQASWGNQACLAPETAAQLGLKDGEVVRLEAAGRAVSLPVLAVPGTSPGVVAVALGYGRSGAGSVADGVGANGWRLSSSAAVTLTRTGKSAPVAIARASAPVGQRLLFPLEPRPTKAGQRRWAMAIDLDACTGCGACVVSCQAENNIPAVGVDEARRRRTMHWLQIDRLFVGPPSEPRVLQLPRLCLHCGEAPCEKACPTLAAVHSREGVSQQVYVRCVGTRYCEAACPVKARRFNWSNHAPADPLARLALNPDVVVRGRGVAEKCSLCVHRIEETKARARADGDRPLRDGEVTTACAQSCPSKAILFGDLADPASAVSRAFASGRACSPVPSLAPAVFYLARGRGGSDE